MNGLRKNLNRLLLILICLFPPGLYGQENTSRKSLNVLFYNTENFFDLLDDSLTRDEEFLPGGDRHWTKTRFNKKKNDIAKVIIASCGFDAPAIAGLAEVENRFVLEDLIKSAPLSRYDYHIIHKDAPDERGIDVALLYRAEIVKPYRYSCFPLQDQEGRILPTREILYAGFIVVPDDTLHVFFNHWPSRYGGLAETEPQRMIAGLTLRKQIENLYKTEKFPAIVVMGDFNDQPHNKSITTGLGAKSIDHPEKRGELINLSADWLPKGTLKYRQSWQVFDQVIVSDFLLDNNRLHTESDLAEIVSKAFLLEYDPKFKGTRPFRTYLGYRYHGGISDHLPVRLKLLKQK